MKYLYKFTNIADFNTAYNGTDYSEPWVSVTTQNDINSFTAKLKVGNNTSSTCTFTFDAFIEAVGFYVWQVTGEDCPNYIATSTRNIVEDTFCEGDIYKSEYNDYGYSWEFDDVGDSNMKLTDVTITDKYSETRVDYNKDLSGIDLVIDCSQGIDYNGTGDWIEGGRIIYSAQDLNLGEEFHYDDFGYGYNINEPSSISTHSSEIKQVLKIRVLNYKNSSEPMDLELPAQWTTASYNQWRLQLNEDYAARLRVQTSSGNPDYCYFEIYYTNG